jgi:hypothetical protein
MIAPPYVWSRDRAIFRLGRAACALLFCHREELPMRTWLAVSLVSITGVVVGCTGKLVDIGPPADGGASSSSSGGSSSSSGGSSSSSGGSSSSSGGSSSSSGGSSSSSGGIDGGDPNECPKKVTVTAAQLDIDKGWKPAVQSLGSCTQSDITQLQANFKNPAITGWFDLGVGLSASCNACAISKDTDANWQVVVGTAADNGKTGHLNFGACFGHVEGPACGKALQYEQFCYNIVCNDCAKTSTERQKCVQKAGASGGPCAALGDSTGLSCPNLTVTAKSCNSVFDAVQKLCGTGP